MNASVAIASQLLHSLSNEHPGATATLKEMEMLEKFLCATITLIDLLFSSEKT